MIAFLFIISMLFYTPLVNFSSPLNYFTLFVVVSFYSIFSYYKGAVSFSLAKYFYILLGVIVINYSFGYQRNTPWFFNYIGFIFSAYVFAHIYYRISENVLDKSLEIITKFNNILCIVIVLYIISLLLFMGGLELFSTDPGNWNGLLFIGTELIGMPKGLLTILVAYCIIWLALTSNKGVFFISIILLSPVIFAGRSSVLGISAALLYLYNKRIKNLLLVKFITLIIILFGVIIIIPLLDPGTIHYDRAANFMVSLDLANEHFFGNGNGTYHWYVESHQAELDNKYQHLFSPFQIEVFLSPESMYNHIIGSFGYLLGTVFFALQGWALWWAYKLFEKAKTVEKFMFLFWFSCAISGVGQVHIMAGFPYFFIWAFVVASIFRMRRTDALVRSVSYA